MTFTTVMSAPIRFVVAIVLGIAGLVVADPHPLDAAQAGSCAGVVFEDRDADGSRLEALDTDGVADDREPGLAGVRVTITDVDGAELTTRSGADGVWSVDLVTGQYPIRIGFEVPAEHAPGRRGPDAGPLIQFAGEPADCDGSPTGNVGLYRVEGYCAEQPEIAVPCYVIADMADYEQASAVHAVPNDVVDNEATDARSPADWLEPLGRDLATQGEIGTVYGLAAARDGTVYAGSFTKRHTRSMSDLNPAGNPTVIYRIPDRQPAEVLTVVDPSAPDPHGRTTSSNRRDDLDAMDDVYTTGLGDIEISPDESTLFAVDLGNRELVEIDTVTGSIRGRSRLDGAALGRDDCDVSGDNQFGDLRGFGLGWNDDTLLIGVVCSAETSVTTGVPVVEEGDAGPGAGDHDQLVGYVYEFVDGRFTERLSWPLAADRGETQNNGLLSNDAFWHPWTPSYPYATEHDVVSYPQPAITDIAVDVDGELVVALGDRWAHQTAPDTNAPAWDGATRKITETIGAGDLQRACPVDGGWVIEGSPECEGGFGNGWEHFDGESYGWHAETALGSVTGLPYRAEIVATQMNPIPVDDTWRSGGLAWHDPATGDWRKGARLYDGRNADPDHTFEKASGLGDLAVLCGGPLPQIGGRIWHDVVADDDHQAGEPSISRVEVDLLDGSGSVIATTRTDEYGIYEFDERNVDGGIQHGATYSVRLTAGNAEDGGRLGGGSPFAGLVPTTGEDTIEVVAGDGPDASVRDTAVNLSLDFGLRDRYDLAITMTQGDRTREDGLVSFGIEVRNQGSLPSGPFEVRSDLPADTSLVAGRSIAPATFAPGSVTWSFTDGQSIEPGGSHTFEVAMRVNDPSVPAVTNNVAVVADSGDDEDSRPGEGRGEDDEASLTIPIFGVSGSVWVEVGDDDGRTTRSAASGTVVQLIDQQLGTIATATTDDAGRFLFTATPAGTYQIGVPSSEFDPGRPLHGYDQAIGTELRDVAEMSEADAIRSAPFSLGAGTDTAVERELGFRRRPPKPLIDTIVPFVIVPIVVLSLLLLLLDRRRHLGFLGGDRRWRPRER